MKALVVDDSRAMRAVLTRYLDGLGIEADGAEDGTAALERLESQGPVDLVLLDWNMPGLSGLEVLERIRARQDWDAIAVVMVTTESELERVVAALDAGANEYLMKPFGREALAEKLEIVGLPIA